MLRSFLIIASLALATGCRATVATLPFPLEVVAADVASRLGPPRREGGTARFVQSHLHGCGTGAALTAIFTLGCIRSGDDVTEVELVAVPEGTRVAVARAQRGWFLWFLPIVSRQRSVEAAFLDALAERLLAGEPHFPAPALQPR